MYLAVVIETVTSYCKVRVLDITDLLVWWIVVIIATKDDSSICYFFTIHILCINTINVPIEVGTNTETVELCIATNSD